MPPFFIVLLAGLSGAAATGSSAPPGGGDAVPPELVAIAARMREVRTISAELRQEKEIAVLAETVRNDGTFDFERPRRLAMDLEGPGGSRLVIDGDVMAVHHKALGRSERTQLSRDPRARAVAEHLFLLLDGDPRALIDVYRLTVLSRAPLRVRLTPLAPALSRILAHVDAGIDARGFVSALTIVEAGGDRTRWWFREPRVNQPIAPERFALPAP